MTNYFAPPSTLGGPSHEGSMNPTRYSNGAILRQLVKTQTADVKYITASFALSGVNANSGKIRIWYVRKTDPADNITLSTFATFLRPGDTPTYTIMQEQQSNQVLRGGTVLSYLEIPFSANISGDGIFGIVLDFQGLDDDRTFLGGIELIL